MNYNVLSLVTVQKREKNQAISLWRKVLLVFVIVSMSFVAGIMLLSYLNGKRLGWEIIRINKIGEPSLFTNLRPKPASPGTEDAADCYVDAMWQIQPGELPELMKVNTFFRVNMAVLPPDKFPADSRKTVTQILSRTEALLAKFDKGAELELTGFDIGILHGHQICKSRLDSTQAAFFLLSLRTLNAVSTADAVKAGKSIESTLKLMRVFDSQPTMLVQVSKMICVRLVCSDVLLFLERCRPSEQQLSKLQALLEDTFPSNSLEASLLAERVYQLEIARNLIPADIASKYLTADAPAMPERLELPRLIWPRMRMRAGAVKYMRNMAWYIEAARRPWPVSLDKIIDANSAVARRSGKLTSALIPFSRLTTETLAVIQSTTAAVAIERYRLQNGSLPDSLDALCPQFIKSIPLDPYTGNPLLYVREGDSFTVYSTGSNRVDDKGMITPKQDKASVLDSGIRVKRNPSQ
jgi:hypothetical protein